MPKGKYTRPQGPSKGRLSDPSGRADMKFREMAAEGDPKAYRPKGNQSREDFASEMRKRERGAGTALNKGYVSPDGKRTGTHSADKSKYDEKTGLWK